MTGPDAARPATAAHHTSRSARWALAANAAVAWSGVLLSTILVAFGAYDTPTPTAGLYGLHPEGVAGWWSRMTDHLSYFTTWSNAVVAVGATMLAWHPDRDTFWRRVIRLDGLLMITITAIVYTVLLRPTAVITGWAHLTDPILHVATPAVTVMVWLGWGPRGLVTGRVVLASLLVPVGWVGWMLARGVVIGAYPYGFVNVAERGYGPVLLTVTTILGFGLVVAAVYWAVDIGCARVRSLSRPRRLT
ncbi:MAG: Pr6Pr family membrane protein [Dermatophilaceae bacterium]